MLARNFGSTGAMLVPTHPVDASCLLQHKRHELLLPVHLNLPYRVVGGDPVREGAWREQGREADADVQSATSLSLFFERAAASVKYARRTRWCV